MENIRLDLYQNGWKPEMTVLPSVAKMLAIVLGANRSQEDRRAAAVTIVELLIPELLPNDWLSEDESAVEMVSAELERHMQDVVPADQCKSPMEIANAWYQVAEVQQYLWYGLSKPALSTDHISADITSYEFAQWLTAQFRRAMAKGIEIASRPMICSAGKSGIH